MEPEPSVTYEAMRSNAERIADANLKERVLKGIEVLNEKFGPNWVDEIDPSELLLSSPTQCVLGQVYDLHIPTDDQIEEVRLHNSLAADQFNRRNAIAVEGYWKGLAILDGEVAVSPHAFGFDIAIDDEVMYDDLTHAWLVVLGADD